MSPTSEPGADQAGDPSTAERRQLEFELGRLRAEAARLEHRVELSERRNLRSYRVRRFGRRVVRVATRLVRERRLRSRES